MTNKAEKAMVMVAFLALAAAPTLAPAESKDGDGYTPETREAFVAECVKASSDRSRPFCECMMGELQKTISYDDFRAMDRDYADGKPSDAARGRMASVARTCTSATRR